MVESCSTPPTFLPICVAFIQVGKLAFMRMTAQEPPASPPPQSEIYLMPEAKAKSALLVPVIVPL